jgi:N-acetylglucosamine kinase-like BadF-type ATPase
MTRFMGIDGGGSSLRVVVTDGEMNVLGRAEGESANPSAIGRDVAARRIRLTATAALASAGTAADDVRAAGIGVAGAADAHSAAWLREVLTAVLPVTQIVPSSDFEIALVGARGERLGVLILAGTGSVAYGVNRLGDSAQAGGWGYLLGDEGSGFWVGMQALKLLIEGADAGLEPHAETLAGRIGAELELTQPRDLIAWTYRAPPPVREVARLAEIVLSAASSGDPDAVQIVDRAAAALDNLVSVLRQRLGDASLPLAFAGGLLSNPNPLSQALCARLRLAAIPPTRYPPAIGAALLAKLRWKGS